ncbi:branched-chain amino acid ABC transporter ATP-binding protein/permease [Labrys monachus]|uniref:Branched-chain amino acid transport system permease protein n=1 Tax=Labrys monachus TaxID=217067 RepID=A0ABU0F9K3_9HYPH|nr:ATP-binding cassette domain-containing protein [Labrys monachus]MDQ0391302.1 branched-chain amino acid transport system permease protein [Labrys monachus]
MPAPENRAALRVLRWIGYVLVLACAVGAPQVLSSIYDLNVLVTMAINAILATGLAIVVRSGRLPLAQATFGGIGGYVSGILMMQHDWAYWPALGAAGIVAAGFGVLLGLTSLRLQGFYFAIATFTFSQIAIVVLAAWRGVTGGLSGMFGLPTPTIGDYDFSDPQLYYYAALVFLALALGIYYLCTIGSRFGRGLSVLGEDEVVAGSLGIPATLYRLAAFAISSFVAGIAGSLNAHFIGGISPSDIAPSVSVFVLVMVMAGGSQTLLGPTLGAVILTLIPELLRASAQWSMVLYGLFLLGYVFLFRQGLLPLVGRAASMLVGAFLPAGRAALAEGAAAEARQGAVALPARVAANGRAGTLSLDGVKCAFGDNQVLHGVGFSVRGGELLGLIGPNGAGKTTLFNVITGNAPLTSGRIEVSGQAVTPRPARMARLGIARTFQLPRVLSSRSVEESVHLAAELSGRKADPAYVDWVLAITQLRDLLHVRASVLSHFERRRLTIAMAIASRPQILLLDEPLAGLDDTETQVVKEQIREIHRQLGCTLLLIEHKLSVVMELCTHLVVLDHGQVIAEGDPETVSRNPEVIQAYLGS